MWDACKLAWSLLIGLFRSRANLAAENLALRQQIIVLRRTAPFRSGFSMVCSSCGMSGAGYCGWGPRPIQPQSGSPGSWSSPADGTSVCTENLNSHIMMMESAEQGM
jgi:hypothetical protein